MGMDSVLKVSLVLDMVDRLTGKMGNVNGSIGTMTRSFAAMQKAGAAMTGIGTGIVSACGKAVTATFDTQNALGEIASLGVQDLQVIESAAKNFSDTWAGTTKADFITASYDIKSGIASLTDEGVAQFTELAALTGKATKSTTEEMGSLFATGYGIYKGAYEEMSDLEFGEMFSAGIATAVKNYKTSGSQMAGAIGMLGATATNAQVPLEEQLAILGQLQTTMSGSEAATKYKSFLNTAAKAGKELGLTFLDANNQLMSMPDILETLRGKYGDTLDAVEKQQLKEAFGTDEAIALIDLLYQNTDQLKTGIDDLHESMSNGVAVTEEMATAINNTPEQKFQTMKQKIHNTAEELGKGLLPTVNSTMDVIAGVIQKGSDWVAANQETVASIMHIVAYLGIFLIAAGTLIAVVGTVGRTFSGLGGIVSSVKKVFSAGGFLSVLGPFALIAAAVAGLIALFQACGGDVSNLQGIFSNVFGAISGFVGNALTSIGTYLPGFLQFGLDLLFNIVSGVLSGLPDILMSGGQIITSLITGILQQIPEILTVASEIINGFLAMIATALPGIILSGGQIITSLITGIVQQFPGITAAAAETINGFLTMIVSGLPGILSAGVQMVVMVLNGIIQALPAVIQSGIQFVLSLLSGIVQNLPAILAMGVSLIGQLLAGIGQVLPNLISGGLAIIGNIISGILQAIPMLLGMIPDLFKTVGDTILSIDWIQIGSNLINGIKDGFMDGFHSLVDSVKGAWGRFTDWLSGGGKDEEIAETVTVTEPKTEVVTPEIATDYNLPEVSLPTTVSTVEAPEIAFDASKYQISGMEGMEAFANGVQLGGTEVQAALDSTAGTSMDSILASLSNVDTSGVAEAGSSIMASLGTGMEASASSAAASAQDAINQAMASATTPDGGTVGFDIDTSSLNLAVGDVNTSVASAQQTTQGGVSAMESAWSSGMGHIQSSVSSSMASVKSTVTSAANQAASAVRNAFAGISVTVPAPKLPHVTVSYSTVGSGDATAQVPNFGVSYYAKGGIMTRPTLFGINGRNGMVGGEAGDEAILPLDTLWGRMQDVVSAVVENKVTKRDSRKSLSKEAISKRSGGTTYNKYDVQLNVDIDSIDSLKKLKNLLDELDSTDGDTQAA
ncbi:phage tail tape measure protein [bacterium 1XD42-54]|nr:phage tail tape measure protein [bacterium 1XD42-54]